MEEKIAKAVGNLVKELQEAGLTITEFDCHKKLPGLGGKREKELCLTIKYKSNEKV